jgi:hypothetical protein
MLRGEEWATFDTATPLSLTYDCDRNHRLLSSAESRRLAQTTATGFHTTTTRAPPLGVCHPPVDQRKPEWDRCWSTSEAPYTLRAGLSATHAGGDWGGRMRGAKGKSPSVCLPTTRRVRPRTEQVSAYHAGRVLIEPMGCQCRYIPLYERGHMCPQGGQVKDSVCRAGGERLCLSRPILGIEHVTQLYWVMQNLTSCAARTACAATWAVYHLVLMAKQQPIRSSAICRDSKAKTDGGSPA